MIRLGTLVSLVTFRHPSVLAKSAVTVDHISGGRVELGIGVGWMEAEHRRWGIQFPPLAARLEMLEEQVEIIRRQWNGDEFSFSGRHYRIQALQARPRPLQRPGPPLLIGGRARPRSARLAARWADEYNTSHATVQECHQRRQALNEACEREGRDPGSLRLSLMTGFLTGTTSAEVREHAARLGERWDRSADAEELLGRLRPSWLVGTVDELVAQVAAYEEAGVHRLMLQHHVFEDLDLVELIGHQVIPGLPSMEHRQRLCRGGPGPARRRVHDHHVH